MSKKRVTIITNHLFCERHLKYMSTVEKYFDQNDYEVVKDELSDLIVVVTCGFHNNKFDKFADIVKYLKDNNVNGDNVVVMGCLPKTHEKPFNDLTEGLGYHVIESGKEEALDELINAEKPFKSITETYVLSENFAKMTKFDPSLFFILVGQGCVGQCTYCVINKARGRMKSRPTDLILEQYKEAIDKGYRKIYLMAEDTFAYGVDIGTNIVELVDKMLNICADVKLYFGSLHCHWIIKYKEDFKRWCRMGVIEKFNIGLQHVNKEILTRMARPTDIKELVQAIKEMREIYPELIVTGDLMVGFPGETAEQFEELLDFVKTQETFNTIIHFGYSDIYGSKSSTFPDKVPNRIIGMRWKLLNDAMKEKSGFRQTFNPDKAFEEDHSWYIIKDSYKKI